MGATRSAVSLECQDLPDCGKRALAWLRSAFYAYRAPFDELDTRIAAFNGDFESRISYTLTLYEVQLMLMTDISRPVCLGRDIDVTPGVLLSSMEGNVKWVSERKIDYTDGRN